MVVLTGSLYCYEVETMLRENPKLEYRCRTAWAFSVVGVNATIRPKAYAATAIGIGVRMISQLGK